jgi:hypothetical protein
MAHRYSRWSGAEGILDGGVTASGQYYVRAMWRLGHPVASWGRGRGVDRG